MFASAELNGIEVGESGINALVADHFGVPIVLVRGDEATWEQAAPFAAGAEHVLTKRSITRGSAENLHPDESCSLIRAAAEKAVARVVAGEAVLPEIARPAALDLAFQTGDMAEVATWARGVERTGERTVRIAGDDLLGVYSSFVAVTYITRQAGGR